MKIEDISIGCPKPIDEENWNLYKWREDNPVDYFKEVAMLFQEHDPLNRDKIFQTLYKINRLYVPDILYKYYSLTDNENLNKKKFKTLCDEQIYMSPIHDFNDPFDGKGFFYNPTRLKDINRLKEHDGRLIEDFTSLIRATCFTANGVNSMPMWAHYGNNHSGFCISYNLKDNPNLYSCVFQVQYTNERLDITELVREQAIGICSKIDANIKSDVKNISLDDRILVYVASLMYNVKHILWSYENEFRCTVGTNESYFQAKPSAIYIGMKCNEKNTKSLAEIADYLEIPLYKMSFKECNNLFELSAKEYNYQ